MDELDALRAMYEYNSIVRKGYLATLVRLPPEERVKDRGASYPSIQAIFVHVLDDYRFWFTGVYQGKMREYRDLGSDAGLPLARIAEAEASVDLLAMGILAELTPADLDRKLTVPGAEDRPGGNQISVRDLLWHMVEEELQHRGELNALLWQMDLEPPLLEWGDHHTPFYIKRAMGTGSATTDPPTGEQPPP
jgi:uncharacterized damage-inducible protein DinB